MPSGLVNVVVDSGGHEDGLPVSEMCPVSPYRFRMARCMTNKMGHFLKLADRRALDEGEEGS